MSPSTWATWPDPQEGQLRRVLLPRMTAASGEVTDLLEDARRHRNSLPSGRAPFRPFDSATAGPIRSATPSYQSGHGTRRDRHGRPEHAHKKSFRRGIRLPGPQVTQAGPRRVNPAPQGCVARDAAKDVTSGRPRTRTGRTRHEGCSPALGVTQPTQARSPCRTGAPGEAEVRKVPLPEGNGTFVNLFLWS